MAAERVWELERRIRESWETAEKELGKRPPKTSRETRPASISRCEMTRETSESSWREQLKR
jgi:hypothetical protein